MTLDPQLIELRRSLGRFRRRVWLRRIVRDGSLILAVVLVAQLGLAIVARLMPFEWHAVAAALVVVAGLVALLVDALRVRPTIAEAALAADSEDGLSDRVSTALALASAAPDVEGEADSADTAKIRSRRCINTSSDSNGATR